MRTISEVEFRHLCSAIFDNSDPTMDESALLQQLLVLTRSRLGHSRPNTGVFHSAETMAGTLKQEIVTLLMMKRNPFFDTTKIIDEYLNKFRESSRVESLLH